MSKARKKDAPEELKGWEEIAGSLGQPVCFGLGMKELAIFSFPLSFVGVFLAEIA